MASSGYQHTFNDRYNEANHDDSAATPFIIEVKKKELDLFVAQQALKEFNTKIEKNRQKMIQNSEMKSTAMEDFKRELAACDKKWLEDKKQYRASLQMLDESQK